MVDFGEDSEYVQALLAEEEARASVSDKLKETTPVVTSSVSATPVLDYKALGFDSEKEMQEAIETQVVRDKANASAAKPKTVSTPDYVAFGFKSAQEMQLAQDAALAHSLSGASSSFMPAYATKQKKPTFQLPNTLTEFYKLIRNGEETKEIKEAEEFRTLHETFEKLINDKDALNELSAMQKTITGIVNHVAVKGVAGQQGITNAHDYTTTEIKANAPNVVAIDDKLKLSNPNKTMEQITKEINADIDAAKKEDTKAILMSDEDIGRAKQMLTNITKTPGVETETNLYVQQFLSRTWDLAKKVDYFMVLNRLFVTLKERELTSGPLDLETCLAEAVDLDKTARIQEGSGLNVMILLNHNIQDQGGCMAGVVARLYPHYAKLVNAALLQLEQMKSLYVPSKAKP